MVTAARSCITTRRRHSSPSIRRAANSTAFLVNLNAERPQLPTNSPNEAFCENDTNGRRLWGPSAASGYSKDAFHEYIVDGNDRAVNPERIGTKVAAHHVVLVPAGGEARIRVRLGRHLGESCFEDFAAVLRARRGEADEFYADLQRGLRCEDERRVQRQ